MIYTIDTDYNVSAFEQVPGEGFDPEAKMAFRTLEEFTTATASWQAPAFTAIWNGFAGVPPFGDLRPVKKFENATIARKRIFVAIEKGFGPDHCATTPTAATIMPEEAMGTTTKKKGNKAKAKPTKAAAAAATTSAKTATATASAKTTTASTTSRKDTVMGLIGRKKGATIGELMEATGWQKHSVRGFIATLHTKHGVDVQSSKNAAGERVYQGVAAS
jgi:hypothetical protein